MGVEEAFQKLHGRLPSDKERQWLMTVQGALGLQENDAFWFIVMMLEHYDGLYREYPKRIAEETARAIEGAKEAFGIAARAEAAEAHRRLADEVAQTSVEIALRIAERPFRIDRMTAAVATLVLFGSICLAAGFKFATTGRPFWIANGETPPVIAVVLGAPAGWMAFAFLLPAAMYVVRTGWGTAMDAALETREKALGAALVSISVVAIVACVAMLLRMI